MHSKYLIVGSSHAALEAATAIRLIDSEGTLSAAHARCAPALFADHFALRRVGALRARQCRAAR